MWKFIGKSNERILCKLSKSGILRLYSIVHVAMETTKTSNFTCQSKSFISIFFTCQVSACELQPFSCHDLPNEYTHKLPKLCPATLISFKCPGGQASGFMVVTFLTCSQPVVSLSLLCRINTLETKMATRCHKGTRVL